MGAAGWTLLGTRGELDPFPMTADPEGYVGRPACDRVLAALQAHVLDTPAPAVLTGPPGLGKTLLLRVLGARLAARARAVYLPYSSLPPEGLCAWALGELGAPAQVNPEAALLERAARERAAGRALLLLLDDVSLLPLATARGMVDLCAESRGALRMVCAATDGVTTGAVVAALGPSTVEARLSEAMTAAETAAYVQQRLERVRADAAARARFGVRELARLHRESGGVPRPLHHLASQLLRGDAPAPPEVPSSRA